jgi:hypothetical protein
MLERFRIQRKTNEALPVRPGRNRVAPFTGVTQIPVHIRALGTLSAVRNAAVGPCTPHNCPPTKYLWCFK